MVYPPLFAKGDPIADRHRGVVPVEELWTMAHKFGKELRELPEGAEFRVVVKR